MNGIAMNGIVIQTRVFMWRVFLYGSGSFPQSALHRRSKS